MQFATQDQKNATPVQKCIATFNIKICYYIVLFIPISSKLDFFAMQNFESKLFPDYVVLNTFDICKVDDDRERSETTHLDGLPMSGSVCTFQKYAIKDAT